MNKRILISNSVREGEKIAKRLGCSFYQEEVLEKYPDTEKVIGIEKKNIKPADIIYWQFNNTENLDDQILNLLAFVDKFSDPSITHLVLPYTPYGRGAVLGENEVDKLYFLLKKLSEIVMALHLVVVHRNFDQSEKPFVGLENIFTIDIDDQLVAFLKKEFSGHFVLVSPDRGFSETVRRLAKRIGVDYLSLTKQRLSPVAVAITGTSAAKKKILKNRSDRFVIVDDIVSTGETLSQASFFLRSLGIGARNISCIAVHDTRRPGIGRKIKVFCSNSLLVDHYDFDITDSVCKALQSI